MFTFEWPITVNHYWISRGARKFLSERAKDYRLSVKLQKPKTFRCIEDKIKITIHAFPPDKRKRDIDNLTKSLLDSMQHAGFYRDDFQIDELHIIRKEVCKPGRVEVWIEEL